MCVAQMRMFSSGMAFLLAALYAHYRDMAQIWNVLSLALFWISSVVFNADLLPARISSLVYFNPLTRVFALMRHYLLYNYFDVRLLFLTILYSVFTFIIGFWIFKRNESKLPELF